MAWAAEGIEAGPRQSARLKSVKTGEEHRREQIREVLKSGHTQRKSSCFASRCGFCCRASSSGKPWIDSSEALPVLYGMVLANSVYLILQTHYWTDNLIYFVVEACFIVYFAGELGARWHMSAPTCHLFFGDPWNVFDLGILVISVIDVSTLLWIKTVSNVHKFVLMLMPLLQIMRLGRWVQELRLIMAGLAHAVRAVAWSMLLLLLTIYFFAIVGNRYVSDSVDFKHDDLTQKLFGSFSDAMLTLFTMATLEDFQDTIRYFLHSEEQGGKFVACALVFFILFANLALLNLVTAVVVDSIIMVLPKKRAEEIAQERSAVVNRLERLFMAIDEDKDEQLSLEELEKGMQSSEDVQNEMNRLQLCSFDIKELFFLIDRDDSGKVSVDQFIEGLLRMTPGEVSKKELLGVQYDLHKMWNMLASGQEQMTEKIANITSKLEFDVAKSLHAVERSGEMWAAHIETLTQGLISAMKAELHDGQVRILQSIESTSKNSVGDKMDHMLKNVEEVVKGGQHMKAKVDQLMEATTPQLIDWPRLENMFLDLKEEHRRLLAPQAPGVNIIRADLSHQAYSEPMAAGNSSACAESTCGPEPEPQASPARRNSIWSAQAEMSGAVAANALRHADERGFSIDSTTPSKMHSSLHPRQLPPLQQVPMQATQLEMQQQLLQIQHQLRIQQSQLQQMPQMREAPPLHSLQSFPDEDMHGNSELSFNALAGPPNSFGRDVGLRIMGVRRWVRHQGLTNSPFDKLVLHLEHVGIQLSVTEQDLLKGALREADGLWQR